MSDSQTNQNIKLPLNETHEQGRRYELWAPPTVNRSWDPVSDLSTGGRRAKRTISDRHGRLCCSCTVFYHMGVP